LAKIMLNLAGAKEGKTLLDPFCGSGTILQEGIIRGLHVVGTDNHNKSIQESKKNLQWLIKKHDVKTRVEVLKVQVQELTKAVKKNSIDLVVTEPEMGPYWKKLPYDEEVKKTIQELVPLYRSLFEELYQVMKPGARIAIILPTFRTFTKLYPMQPSKIMREGQFKQINKPLEYWHSSSKVRRNIYVFEKI